MGDIKPIGKCEIYNSLVDIYLKTGIKELKEFSVKIDPKNCNGDKDKLFWDKKDTIKTALGTNTAIIKEKAREEANIFFKIYNKSTAKEGDLCTTIKSVDEKDENGEPKKFGYSDVLGMEKEKRGFDSYFIYPLQYPKLFREKKVNVLLYGPPGTGKTFLVKGVVGEIRAKAIKGLQFFVVSPDQIKGKFVGETEKAIAGIFECARDGTPTIIFFDEFESIGSKRGEGEQGGQTAGLTIPTLLQYMDGFKGEGLNVSIIAATNLPKDLDNAVYRRFTKKIFIDLPDTNIRLDAIKSKLAKKYSTNLKTYPAEAKNGVFQDQSNFREMISVCSAIIKDGKIELSVYPKDVNKWMKDYSELTGPDIYFRDKLEGEGSPSNGKIGNRKRSNFYGNGKDVGYTFDDVNKFMDSVVNIANLYAISDKGFENVQLGLFLKCLDFENIQLAKSILVDIIYEISNKIKNNDTSIFEQYIPINKDLFAYLNEKYFKYTQEYKKYVPTEEFRKNLVSFHLEKKYFEQAYRDFKKTLTPEGKKDFDKYVESLKEE